MTVPDEAVEAAAELMDAHTDRFFGEHLDGRDRDEWTRRILKAAAPYLQQEMELKAWKLAALARWAEGIINESPSPQYGFDAKAILSVGSMDEAKRIDAL